MSRVFRLGWFCVAVSFPLWSNMWIRIKLLVTVSHWIWKSSLVNKNIWCVELCYFQSDSLYLLKGLAVISGKPRYGVFELTWNVVTALLRSHVSVCLSAFLLSLCVCVCVCVNLHSYTSIEFVWNHLYSNRITGMWIDYFNLDVN